MKIQRFYVNPFQEACYVVSEMNGMKEKECVIVDCGAYYPEEEEAIAQYVKREGLEVKAHLLTHAHLDHMFGARFVYETWGVLPIVHEADEELFGNMEGQARMFGIPLLREPLREHKTMASLPPYLTYLHTPGHTQGSVCYTQRAKTEGTEKEEGEVLFSGDTLFQSGVGRTDLPGGNYGQLMHSLGLLARLDSRTKVLPGHGGSTSIGQEAENNPYL